MDQLKSIYDRFVEQYKFLLTGSPKEIVAVGIGDNCFIVYLAKKNGASNIPEIYDGIPVKKIYTGPITVRPGGN